MTEAQGIAILEHAVAEGGGRCLSCHNARISRFYVFMPSEESRAEYGLAANRIAVFALCEPCEAMIGASMDELTTFLRFKLVPCYCRN